MRVYNWPTQGCAGPVSTSPVVGNPVAQMHVAGNVNDMRGNGSESPHRPSRRAE